MSFFQRFLLILVSFALIPAIIFGIWMLNSTAGVRENAEGFHKQIVQLSAQMAENAALEMNRSLGFVEDLERNQSAHASLDYKILQQAAAGHSELEYLAIFKSSSTEFPPLSDPDIYGNNTIVASQSLMEKARQSGKIQIGPVELKAQIPLISLAYPLSRNRCLYVEYSLKNLWKKLKKIRVGKTGRLILLDSRGEKLPGIAKGFPGSGWKWPKPLSRDSGWDTDIPSRLGTLVAAYSAIPALNLWAVSLEPRAEAFARPEGYLEKVLSFLFLLLVLSAAGAWWVTGRLAPPLERLALASQRAAKNDLNIRLPEEGWGELKTVAKSFNQMAQALRSYHEMQVEKIVEERARILSLVYNIPEGVVMADFNGNVLHINAVGRLILGLDMLSNSLPPGGIRGLFRQPEILSLIAELMGRKKRQAMAELELKTLSGQARGIFSVSGAIVSAEKKDIGILILLRDITVEKQLSKMKEDFFHSVAHDIGNLLTPFAVFFNLLRKSNQFGDAEKKYLGYSEQARDRLAAMMKDILDIAKLESGTLELQLGAAHIGKILENMRALYEIQGQNKEISISFTVGPPPHEFICDQQLLERVVMNLIGNALKFTPKGGAIAVMAGSAGPREIEFSVRDTGPGIPKHALQSVFGKFEQVPGQQSRSGYGLGLAICKKIVELHNGKIWVESEEGKGSNFKFRIPLKTPASIS